MEGVGKILRRRAREDGWSDAEVARRVGIQPRRYSNYVNDVREPDFETFVKICRTLGLEPTDRTRRLVWICAPHGEDG